MRSAKTSGDIGCFLSNSAAYDKFVEALLHQVGLDEKQETTRKSASEKMRYKSPKNEC